MIIDSILSGLEKVSSHWAFLGVLVLLMIGLYRVEKFRPVCKILLVPVGLLLARKLVLFLPVFGAISSMDRVVFFDPLGYWAHVGAIVILALAGLAIRYDDEEIIPGAFMFFFLVFMFIWFGIHEGFGLAALFTFLYFIGGIIAFIGFLGFCIIMIVLTLGWLKLLIISPLLLPVIWIGIPLQFLEFFRSKYIKQPVGFWETVGGRMLIVIVLGSVAQFVEQGVVIHSDFQRPLATQINEEWPRDSEPLIIHDELEFLSFDFIEIWFAKLSESGGTSIRLTEKRLPYNVSPETIRAQLIREPGITQLLPNLLRNTGLGWMEEGDRRTTVLTSAGIVLFLFLIGFVYARSIRHDRTDKGRLNKSVIKKEGPRSRDERPRTWTKVIEQ